MLTNVNTSYNSLESDQVSLIINPLDMNDVSRAVIESMKSHQGFYWRC